MLFQDFKLLCVAFLLTTASTSAAQTVYSQNSSPNAFEKYTISANGINATFIPYGARLTSLFVNDKHGKPQDIIVGYDEADKYARDSATVHTYFGAVVGRYANRIKNGTFTIDGQTSHVVENEHDGKNTLHGGGAGGYDVQNWTVTAHTTDSITFTLHDNGLSGFPGAVLNTATYTVTNNAEWISRLVSIPLTTATPIMLANHPYWNLGAYISPDAQTILDNTLHMPYAKRYIATDGILIPTGELRLTAGTPLDFIRAKPIGQDILSAQDLCGSGCVGYDNALILDRPVAAIQDPELEVLRMWAPSTGIEMRLRTNMQGLQVYSCDGQNGTIPVKRSQQHGFGKGRNGTTTFVEKYGCVVLETQDWIDGINQPQWGRDQYQIFSPTTEPAVNYQRYIFTAHE